MDERLHIIVAGDQGKVFRMPFYKKRLKFLLGGCLVGITVLTLCSGYSVSLFLKNRDINQQLTELKEQLVANEWLLTEHKRKTEEQQLRLGLELAQLELKSVHQENQFKEEKETLLSTAVSELTERSELIEQIIGSIGIEIPEENKDESNNSGGPFIQEPAEKRDDLILKADKYLNAIRYLPLGRPVEGPVTSRYGKRKDPMNKKIGFHAGIDFRGQTGDKVYATADGVVKKALRNGGFGNYVELDHGNGYVSTYSHMQAYLVRKGDRVKRGQLIGLVGSTGRSTGPHLHYEVHLNDKPINPYGFMKVAGMLDNKSLPQEN